MKDKIENGAIKRSDFDERLQFLLKREIDAYFACFDPNDPNYKSFWKIEDQFDWESLMQVWGSLKMATESFKRGLAGESTGQYFHSAGYLIVGARNLAYEKCSTEVLTKLLDEMEYFPAFILEKEDKTELFELCLKEICARYKFPDVWNRYKNWKNV